MKKYTAFFSTALIALVLFGAACDTADRDTMTTPEMPPSPEVSPMMSPETYPSPGMSPGASPSPGMMGTGGVPEGATHRVADITGGQTDLTGQTVTVVANVDEVYSPRAFKLDEDSPMAGGIDNDLLVLGTRTGNLQNINNELEGNKVRVTGVVQRMDARTIEREIGWDLPSNLETEFRGKPVLIARSVERVNQQ